MKNQTVTTILIIVVVALVIGGAFILRGVNYLILGSKNEPVAESNLSIKRQDIQSWQTYRNEEHGVVFNFPEKWVVDTTVSGENIIADIGIYPTSEISIPPDGNSRIPIVTISLDIHDQDGWYIYQRGGDEVVSSGKKYLRKGGRDSETIRYAYTTHKDGKFDRSVEFIGFLHYEDQYDVEEILFNIANSFHFIVDMSEWVTYRSEKYRFEFQYSHEWPELSVSEAEQDGMSVFTFGPSVKTWSDYIEFPLYSLIVSPNKNRTKFILVGDECDVVSEKEWCFSVGNEWSGNSDINVTDYDNLEQMKAKYIKEFKIGDLQAYTTVIGAESPTTYVRIEGTDHGFEFIGFLSEYEPEDEFYAIVNSFREIN